MEFRDTWLHLVVALAVALNVTPALMQAPEIQVPQDLSTVDGSSAVLKSRVIGDPKPQIKWVRDSLELTSGRYNVLDNGDLEIRRVSMMDAGRYTCSASNTLGSVEASAELTVKERTIIINRPQDNEVRAGSTATFRCNAVSDATLELKIDWLNNGELIDFDSEPRFVRFNDNSLTITNTTEVDSGTYTCVASTELDKAEAQATLTVQDVPNAPILTEVVCNQREASISWKPTGDNHARIRRYTVQYNTFTPDVWKVAFDWVPSSYLTYTVSMSPWANYTFRVLAINKIGPSSPSGHSKVCTTQPDVPYKNPDNVEGKGTDPSNIVISWTPIPEIEHNAPGLYYRVSWRRDIPGQSWNNEDISDWHKSELVIPNQPTFQPYHIKVTAINKKGESNVAPKEVLGFSGEDVPTQAPSNFSLEEVVSPTSALLTWNPVPPDTVRGHFKGYKIQTWTDREGEAGMRNIHVKGDATRALVNRFVPHTKNYARVLVYNSLYNGPPSETLSFDTPEGVPGSVHGLEAFQMGPSALFLVWKKPEQENGVLTGYKIYYQTVKGTRVGPLMEREPHVSDPKMTRAKLAGLAPGTKYRLHVKATTRQGEGEDYFIESRTRSVESGSAPPDIPSFKLEFQIDHAKVTWIPNLDGRPGSDFYVKYKLKNDSRYISTEVELYEDYLTVGPLYPGLYEFKVVAVDVEYSTESETQELLVVQFEEPSTKDSVNSQHGPSNETNEEEASTNSSSIDTSSLPSSETNKEEPPTTTSSIDYSS